ncbi:polynucleotide kinase 3 phosphatase-domain-containing protein [Pisolithus thermaeus]|nr:polynucleotide kinase 3 phosphatase-domain-containing protein [Pisolithus thermaeus]
MAPATAVTDSPTRHASASGPSKKRDASDLQTNETGPATDGSMNPRKVAKVHPFFSKQSEAVSLSPFQWLKPSLGPKRTCLHGINLSPPCLPKVAALDLDGTVIKSNHKNRGKGTALQWEWWRNVVPSRMRALHEEGHSIVLISNQALKSDQLTEWKKKIPLIAAALPDVPFRILAASAKDGYRKPMPGMWYELERIFKEQGVEIDKASSFYVGDAAGRPDDFASTDRKWALNVGIPFYTPEVYFLKLPAASYSLPGFHVSSLPALEPVTPVDAAVIPDPPRQELVIFTGYPCLGKSSFYRRHFSPAGYVHINQDVLGSRPKCIRAAEEALKDKKSIVVDNTNRDVATRKHYLDLAKRHGVAARCFLFSGPMELAWHNNLYRAYIEPPQRDILPYLAFIGFRENYEEPHASEGFSEVVKISWKFEGDEEARRRWSMWLQIDGK